MLRSVVLTPRESDMTTLTNLYWNLTYFPRCTIALAKYRTLPSNMSLAATLVGIAKMQVRPHWLRG